MSSMQTLAAVSEIVDRMDTAPTSQSDTSRSNSPVQLIDTLLSNTLTYIKAMQAEYKRKPEDIEVNEIRKAMELQLTQRLEETKTSSMQDKLVYVRCTFEDRANPPFYRFTGTSMGFILLTDEEYKKLQKIGSFIDNETTRQRTYLTIQTTISDPLLVHPLCRICNIDHRHPEWLRAILA